MLFTKDKLSIRPAIKTLQNRNNYNVSAKSKRSASFNPRFILKITTPTAPTDVLPPIKSTIQIRKFHQQMIKQNRKTSKISFDERIISSKDRQVRTNSHAMLNKNNPGLSKQALFQRKQSHLNTYFNQRKNKLKQITHQNKRIYEKINSQKSLYSSRQSNKQYDSSCQLSRRLSTSKLSKPSSRNSIQRASRSRKGREKLLEPKKKQIKIESQSINKVQSSQMHRYLNIFCNNIKIKQSFLEKDIGKQVFDLKNNRTNKENKAAPQLSSLHKIVQEFGHQSKRKTNIILGRIL